MRLKALDQIHVSAVKAESIRPHEEFDVPNALGEELLKKHPSVFKKIAAKPSNKAAPTPKNKAEG